jgi:DNA-binding protein H-NS
MEQLEGEARERLIRWLRRRMDEYGITLQAVAESISADRQPERPVLYRDAMGNTWDGYGDMPDWLRRAVAAGQQIDFYRCAEQ